MRSTQLIYPVLGFKIVGMLFDVYNNLGFGYQERYYQRAFVSSLQEVGIPFSREHRYSINFKSQSIGRYYVDFVIDDRVAVEMKVGKKLQKQHLNQLLAYLKHADLRLGILAVFTPDGVLFERVAN